VAALAALRVSDDPELRGVPFHAVLGDRALADKLGRGRVAGSDGRKALVTFAKIANLIDGLPSATFEGIDPSFVEGSFARGAGGSPSRNGPLPTPGVASQESAGGWRPRSAQAGADHGPPPVAPLALVPFPPPPPTQHNRLEALCLSLWTRVGHMSLRVQLVALLTLTTFAMPRLVATGTTFLAKTAIQQIWEAATSFVLQLNAELWFLLRGCFGRLSDGYSAAITATSIAVDIPVAPVATTIMIVNASNFTDLPELMSILQLRGGIPIPPTHDTATFFEGVFVTLLVLVVRGRLM